MKAVLISIHPRYCENIASGKKTVEVRKTAPKIPTPFKCYIYCTSVKSLPLKGYAALQIATNGRCDKWSGKVVGEFVCDKIGQIRFDDDGDLLYEPCLAGSSPCLSLGELQSYIGVNNVGYGWHISDLKIYDKPKELGAFIAPCKWGHRIDDEDYECLLPRPEEKCQYECADKNPDGSVNIFTCGLRKPFTRPPQSWCYVEEI